MSTKLEKEKQINKQSIPSGKNKTIAIIVSEWNSEITLALKDAAVKALLTNGVETNNIIVEYVPGSVELTFAAKIIAEQDIADSIICLGCVVKGETPHFDYVCQSVTYGITELNLSFDIPIIFGVLTVNTQQQAIDRAGGKLGNKGEECAIVALKMMSLTDKY